MKTKYPLGRVDSSSVLIDNKIYLFGGRNEIKRMNDLWVFDIE